MKKFKRKHSTLWLISWYFIVLAYALLYYNSMWIYNFHDCFSSMPVCGVLSLSTRNLRFWWWHAQHAPPLPNFVTALFWGDIDGINFLIWWITKQTKISRRNNCRSQCIYFALIFNNHAQVHYTKEKTIDSKEKYSTLLVNQFIFFLLSLLLPFDISIWI